MEGITGRFRRDYEQLGPSHQLLTRYEALLRLHGWPVSAAAADAMYRWCRRHDMITRMDTNAARVYQ